MIRKIAIVGAMVAGLMVTPTPGASASTAGKCRCQTETPDSSIQSCIYGAEYGYYSSRC